jgi:hypothetical protein
MAAQKLVLDCTITTTTFERDPPFVYDELVTFIHTETRTHPTNFDLAYQNDFIDTDKETIR